MSVSELEKIRKQEMVLEDTRGALSLAQREGIEQGIIQGIEQGIIQGIEQGIIQGRVQGERRVILRQLERRVLMQSLMGGTPKTALHRFWQTNQ
nr:hypothetical protein [Moorena producens]